MTDLRARLADALSLRRHEFRYPSELHPSCCTCGDAHEAFGQHLADVVLSLPGIAIVDVDRHRRQLFDLLKGIIDDEWGPYEDDHYWLMVDEFLAAANAAEEKP